MIKNSKKNIDFLNDPLTTLNISECLHFYDNVIESLEKLNDDAMYDLVADLKDNIKNLQKVYNIYTANILANNVNNLSDKDLQTYKLLSQSIDSMFNKLL